MLLKQNVSSETSIVKQNYRYHKLRKAFSKFYRRHYDIKHINLMCDSKGRNLNFMVTFTCIRFAYVGM